MSIFPSRQQRGRSRAITLFGAAVALIAAQALTACTTERADQAVHRRAEPVVAHGDHEHHHETSALPDNGDDVFDIVAGEYTFTLEHATLSAGLQKVRLTNHGAEAHQVQFGKVPNGVDADAFVKTFDQSGEPAAMKLLQWSGGVNGVPPSESGVVTTTLEQGSYLVVCFFPTADGTSHVAKHMVAPLQVVTATSAPVSPPAASETVVLSEYHIAVPDGFTGHGTVAFRNEGQEDHEMVLVRLNEGKTLADVAAYQKDHTLPMPFAFAGGMGIIPPHSTASSEMNLKSGSYLATCFVAGPDGQPHLNLGMLTTFTIP